MNTIAVVLIAWAGIAIAVALYLGRRSPSGRPPYPIEDLCPGRVFLIDPTGRTWSVVQMTHTREADHHTAALTVTFIPIPEDRR